MIPDKPYELGEREQKLIREMSTWAQYAACASDNPDPGFIAERTNSAKKNLALEEKAKGICKGCSVRIECLDHALHLPETSGIWGGLNPAERFELAKRLGIEHV